MEAIWNKVKDDIKSRIAGHSFRMWIEPLTFKEVENGKMVISCPNTFSKNHVRNHYSQMIVEELSKATDSSVGFSLEIADRKADASESGNKKQLSLPHINVRPTGGRFLRKNFTFDKFVVSRNNNFAYSASLSLAMKNNSIQNSLFLISKTGLGKSHLSQAIGNYILNKSPLESVYYITAEDFMNEMIHAFKNNNIETFKEKYRNQCDVLLLENVHFLSGKERTQVELTSALDYLLDADKTIIFTSCYLPGEIPKMNDQLCSRFSSGLISDIQPPDFETRMKILKLKSIEKGYEVPRGVVEYLAGELKENVRQLESGLLGVITKSKLMDTSIDLDLAQSVVKNIARKKESITIDVIKKFISGQYKITVEDLVSRSRKQSIVRPRQMAIYLSRKYTDQTLEAIGRSFNRYHATALHSINAVEKGLRENVSFKQQVEYLCKKLESDNS